MAITQDLSQGNYGAVIPITASAMFTPKRDATNGVLTAGMPLVSLADQTGAAVGTSGNPIFVNATSTPTAPLTSKGYQQVAATAALVTPTVPAGTSLMIVSIVGNNARYRADGTSPTATVGMPIYMGDPAYTFTSSLAALKFIAQSGTTEYNFDYYG